MTNANNSAALVTSLEIYSDASGAPAVVRVGRFMFSADTLGEVKLRRLGDASAWRTESKIAASRARAAYVAARDARLPAGWLEANVAMYA